MKNNLLLIYLLCILCITASCKKGLNPETDYLVYTGIEGLIGPGGGKITVDDPNSKLNGAVIDIPQGALTSATTISVKDYTIEMPTKGTSGIPMAIEFLPDGLKFLKPAKFTFKVPDDVFLDNGSIIGPFDKKSGYVAWHESEVNLTDRIISTNIDHFSLYVVIDLKFSENPYSFSFDQYYKPGKYIGDTTGVKNIADDISRAFIKWEAYSKLANIKFYAMPAPYPTISVSFAKPEKAAQLSGLNDLFGDDSAGVVLYGIFDDTRLILLNDEKQWMSSISAGKGIAGFNIERAVSHEIGHFFGLKDIKEIEEFSTNSLMGGANADIPLSVCATDLANLKEQYPEISNLTDYGTATGIVNIFPERLTYSDSAGKSLRDLIKVKVTDKDGNGVPGATVVFESIAIETENVEAIISESVFQTDDNGVATLHSLRLPYVNGTSLLSAKTWTGSDYMAGPREVVFRISSIVDEASLVTDIDGNNYSTGTIGTQVWMLENLKTTKLNDGTQLINQAGIEDPNQPGYYWNNGTLSNTSPYGAYYNFNVVSTGKLCPLGWHVPSSDEVFLLRSMLLTNGYNFDGSNIDNKMGKALASTVGWKASTIPGAVGNSDYPEKRNLSSFSALPGGWRGWAIMDWYDAGSTGFWWTSTEYSMGGGWSYSLYYDNSAFIINDMVKDFSFPVRCLKDN